MRFEDVRKVLDGVPHITPEGGKLLYDFVSTSRVQNVLELGFAHGTSTCYLAAALHENGEGRVTTIDNQSAKGRNPDIFTLLERTSLQEYVRPIFADTSYNWELMKVIEAHTHNGVCQPVFDFCFIDGAHTWEVDGLAFFLVEKLLKPGGWLLFDDLHWTYDRSPRLKSTEEVRKLPEDQRTTAQVEKVFSLLVAQHPNFENLSARGGWGWAQKTSAEQRAESAGTNVVELTYARNESIKTDVLRILKKARRRAPF